MTNTTTVIPKDTTISLDILRRAFGHMHTAQRMAELYDEHKPIASKYVHSTSRGHEAIQLAAAYHLQ
ncbi:MAG TPA: hypothetical protein DCP28_19640, partial [Cytophagales bacterium]|nr:hypothetical protein [Cytophagales bacterium]